MPGRGQPVEKVDVGLIAITNRAPNAPRTAYLVPFGAGSGANASTKGVFQQAGVFSEVHIQHPALVRDPQRVVQAEGDLCFAGGLFMRLSALLVKGE